MNNALEKNQRQTVGYLVPNATPARISDSEVSELKVDLAKAIINVMESRKLTLSHTARIVWYRPC